MVLISTSRFHLQQALYTLSREIVELGLEINHSKTEAMKSRLGGRVAATDALHLQSHHIKYTNHFCYLGVVIPLNGSSFNKHIQSRTHKALIAMDVIRSPSRLSISTALQLFNIYVASVASYGIEVIWPFLTVNNMIALEKIKATFLKRVLCLHITSKSRLTYLLAGTPLLMEELVRRFGLPTTECYKQFLLLQENKFDEVDENFYLTPAILDDAWKGINRENRHLITRYAAHGFHHRICSTNGYHEPCDTCICKYCHRVCDRYHVAACPQHTTLHRLNSQNS